MSEKQGMDQAPAVSVTTSSAQPCRFVWFDLMTGDSNAAAAFYGSVIGWGVQDAGMAGPPYLLLTLGADPIGGLMGIHKEAGFEDARPTWLGHIGVDDVDAYAERVRAAGGAIQRGPEDIPGVGRFAVATDPQGATFLMFQPNRGQVRPQVPEGTPGHVGWCELLTDDLDAAFAFYAGIFGWTSAGAIDMGADGMYPMFAAGENVLGGLMKRTPETPVPHWLYYFNVAGIDTAVEKVTAGGGKVVSGPSLVGSGTWIAVAIDPQGAPFALASPAR